MECDKNDDDCCQATQDYGVRQTLDEMEFERGIWAAAKDGDLGRVQELLDKGVSPNVEDSAGYRPLHYASRNNHYDVSKLLLDYGADINAITRSVRATPLHRAATQGHSEVVKMLLDHGANVNLVDADGRTALHRALLTSLPSNEICEQLIRGTDLQIRDNAGYTANDLLQQLSETKQHLVKMKEVVEGMNIDTDMLEVDESPVFCKAHKKKKQKFGG